MKNFNFFEKLWEHSRTLRRVGLVLVMCIIAITQAYASDPHFHLTGAPSIGSWSNSATEWKLSSPASSALNNGATFNEYCTYMWLSEGDYFGLNNGSQRYSRNDYYDVEIKEGDGSGVYGYPADAKHDDKSFHYVGATGLVRINAAQTGSGNSYGSQGEWYPYIWVEESLEAAILTGSKIMFYFGIADSWNTNWFYLSKEGDQNNNKSYKAYYSTATKLNTRIAVAYVDANTTYYIASAQSGGTCIKMSSNAAAGNLYSLNSSGGNNIYVNTGNVPHFATTSVTKAKGTEASTIAATAANSIFGNAYTYHYYYTTDGGSTFTKFDPTDISGLASGTYTVYALGWDDHILVKSDNSVTLKITVPITLNANGGVDGAVTSVNAVNGDAASGGNIAGGSLPTKTNYVFTGFYTSGGTQVINANGEWISNVSGYTDADGKWTCTAGSTLYAHWEDQWNVKGSWDSWAAYKGMPNVSSNTYQVTLSLSASTTYDLKVVKRTRGSSDVYYGKAETTFTRSTITSAKGLVTTDGATYNLHVTADIAGDYVFTFVYDESASNMKVYVKYPCFTDPAGGTIFYLNMESSLKPGSAVKAPTAADASHPGLLDLISYASIANGVAYVGNKSTSSQYGSVTTTPKIKLDNNDNSFVLIQLDCALETGDKITVSTNNDVYVTTSSTRASTYTISKSATYVCPAAFNNATSVYLWRKSNDAEISDITIERCSNPAAPTAFSTSNVMATTATFSITDAADAESYDLYYAFGSPSTPTSGTSATENVTTKTPTITGLSASTTYNIWVRSVCDANHKSSWYALSGNTFKTADFEITDGGKNTSGTPKWSDKSNGNAIVNTDIDGIITGGTVVYSGTGTLTGNDTHGIIFDNDNDELTITVTGMVLPAGAIITIVQHGNSSTSKATGFKISGNSMSPETCNNGSTTYKEMTQTYTVVADDGVAGKNNFKIKWTVTNQVYLKSLKITGCEEAVCTDPTSPSISGTTSYTAGGTISLTASATGTDGSTTYTWYKGDNWAAASAGDPVQAESTSGATYTKASCVVGDAGTYWCNISNGDGCDVQVSKTITVVCVSHSVNLSSSGSVTGGTFATSSATVCVGETATLTATPSSGYTFTSWSATGTGSSLSSETTNPATLTMGTADVTVNATFTPIPVATITLNKTETTLTYGGSTETLSVTSVLPANALDKTYTWSSSNDAVATVTSGGVVSPVAAGSCEIYATANDGSGVKGTCAVTVNKADLSVTATAGEATSVTHNSATLPFELSSTTGVASVTLKVYDASDDSEPVKTVSGVTAATSGSGAVTGLSASTTYYFTVTPIGDSNHNNGSESDKSEEFTTEAAPTLTAISANTLYQATNMLCAGMSPLGESDTYFTDDSYSTDYRFYYDVLAENGPKAHTVSSTTLGSGQPYEATFTSEIWVKGTSTVTDGIPSEPSIKFLTPSVDGTLYLYIESSSCPVKFKKADGSESNITGLTQVVEGKIYSTTVVANSEYYIYGNGTKNTGFYGLKLVTCTDPGLAFAEDSKTTTLCDAAPTNALTNTHSVAVSYTSSDPTVATVASDGTLTIKKAGTTTITASSLEQTISAVTYCADNASYTLTVNASTAAGLAYGTSTVKKDVGDAAFTNTLTNSNGLTVTYTSSDEDVATVASDGEVTIKAAGTTTITASSAQQKVSSTCYAAGSATYTLTVYPVYTVTYNAMGGTCSPTSTNTTTALGKVTLPSATHASYTTYSWVTSDGTEAGGAGDTYTPEGTINLYAKWSGSCAGGGGSKTVLFKAQAKTSGMPSSLSSLASNTSLTTDNYLSVLDGGTFTLNVGTAGHVKANKDSLIQIANTAAYFTITLSGGKALQAGDIITTRLKGHAGYLQTGSGSYSAATDISLACDVQYTTTVTSSMVGASTIYLKAASNNMNFAYVEIYRPAEKLLYMQVNDGLTNGNIDTDETQQTAGVSNLLRAVSGGEVYTGATTAGHLKIVNTNEIQLTNNTGYLKLVLPKALAKGDILSFNSSVNYQISFTTSKSYGNTIGTSNKSYTIPTGSGLIGQSTIYVWYYSASNSTNIKNLAVVRPEGGSSCKTVTYNGNGADGGYTNDPTQYTSGQSPEILDCGYTRTGYAFIGWADGTDHRDAETVDYQPGDHITSISDDVKLYAIWKQIKYFTGAASTTSWNTDGNWSPSVVPDITDPVVIQANVTVDINNAKALRVDIETGKTLTINAGKALIIAETLTKNGGATAAADVIINSTRDIGTGALIIGSEAGDNAATMNFETKAILVGGSTVNQFIGSPFSNAAPYVDYGQQLYKFCPKQNGDRGWWQSHTSLATMTPFWGYNVLCTETSFLNLNWTGKLNPSESKTITDFYYNGSSETDNMFANSWTAPIHVGEIEDADLTNVSKTLYMFNAGTPAQEAGHSGADAKNSNDDPGTYISIPIHSATYAGIGVIPSMQAFYVLSTGSDASIMLDYNKIVYTPALTSVGIVPNRAPKHNAEVVEPEVIKLHVQSETGWGANTYVLGRADFAEGYEDGWDGAYIEGESATPKLYTPSIDGNMFINCLPEIEGTVVGFRKGSSDNNYIFSFDYDGDEVWYLNDQKAQKSTQIMNGQTYAFVSEAGDNAARFVISATPINKIATGCESVGAEAAKVRKLIINDKVYIIRGGQVFDVLGKTIKK